MARVLLAGLLVLLPAALAAQPPAGRSGAPLAIIVHRSNPVDGLTRAELRQILLLERQSWPHSRKITLVMRDSGQPERDALLAEVCSMSDAEYVRHVLQATYRGAAVSGPRTISTPEGMRRFIFNVPGALGYVLADEVDDTVKVLRIDGLLPGDPGYALHGPARPTR